MGSIRWVVLVGVVTGCAEDLCAEVTCRRPVITVCLSEAELSTSRATGTCEPATGECSYREPVITQCLAGERCSEGACRCVPSLCPGCCMPNGGCVSGTALGEQACGLGGAICGACAPGAACFADAGCVTCPPQHVVQRHACVDDDVELDVSLQGATRWPPPPFDGGVTLWHLGPAGDVVVTARARSPLADLNGTGRSELQIPISLATGGQTIELTLEAASGRTVHQMVTAFPSRAISDTCHVTTEAFLSCGGQVHDGGVFVGTADECGLTATGEVWCNELGLWRRRFVGVADITDLTLPCALTRSGRAVCAEPDGGLTTQRGTWSALECRTGACCGLTGDGLIVCWGSHEYNLFDRNILNPLPSYPEPREVYGFPGRYVRLTSAHKTFFGATDAGVWTAASNRMGLPGDVPFVIADATASTLKLDSPYYCIMGLEADGGLWTITYYSSNVMRRTVSGGPFLDFAPTGFSSFRTLDSAGVVGGYDCPP